MLKKILSQELNQSLNHLSSHLNLYAMDIIQVRNFNIKTHNEEQYF